MIEINISICGRKITVLGVYGMNEESPINRKKEYFEQNNEIVKVGTKTNQRSQWENRAENALIRVILR